MYLSCLEIDTATPRGRLWFANPYRIHQRLLIAFDDGTAGRVLFRIEPDREPQRIVMQSPAPAEWSRAFADHPVLASVPRQKELAPRFAAGQRLRFLLFANPTRRSKRHMDKTQDGRTVGKRVGLVREVEQRAWLERKGEAGGFRPSTFQVRPRGEITFRRGSRPGAQTHVGVEFEGVLEVVDPARFAETVSNGIGSGKAFGFGLLSIAPVP